MLNEKIMRYKWTIFVWINFLWLLGTLALGYTAFTSVPPSGSTRIIEAVKIIFLSLGGLGVVLPTFISACNAIESRSTQILENTFRLIEKWDDPLMFKARSFTRKLKIEKANLSDNELISKIESDPQLLQSMILVMNYFDQIRVSEETGRINASIFNRSLGPVMIDYYHRFKPYMEKQGETYIRDWEKIYELAKRTV